MLKISVDAVIQKIRAETGLSEAEIKEQIKAKVASLEGLVSEEGAAFIIAAEMGVQVMRDSVSVQHKISEIKTGERDVDITGTIERTFRTIDYVNKGVAKKVSSILVSDDSSSVRVVMWEDKAVFAANLKRGQKIRVKGAQAKQGRDGSLELHIGNFGTITILQDSAPETAKQIKLSDLRAGDTVSVLADIVQVREPKTYFICSTCNKKVIPAPEGFLCPDHKKVIPRENMLCSFVLDDGTATARAVVFGQAAEDLLGIKISDIKTIDAAALIEAIQTRLHGRTVLVEGRAKENKNFSTIEISAMRVDLEPNPRELANKLLRQ